MLGKPNKFNNLVDFSRTGMVGCEVVVRLRRISGGQSQEMVGLDFGDSFL